MSNTILEPKSDAEARAALASREMPVLVDFTAQWCGPCKSFAPTLEAFAADNSQRVQVVKIDVDALPAIAKQANVRGIPALILLKDGQAVAAKTGALSRGQLDNFVNTYVD